MNILRPLGIVNDLKTKASAFDDALDHGITVSPRFITTSIKLTTSRTFDITIDFTSLANKTTYFDSIELVTASSELTLSQIPNQDGSIICRLSYTGIAEETFLSYLYVLFKGHLEPIRLPINIVGYDVGRLSCENSLTFPATEVYGTSTQSLVLNNLSETVPLTIQSFRLSSTVGLDYVFDATVFPINIEPLGVYTLPINFIPSDNSTRTALLSLYETTGVKHADGDIALIGQGTVEGITNTTPVVTFANLGLGDDEVLFIGKGIIYRTFSNTTEYPFLITTYTFAATDCTLLYPDLINGTLINEGTSMVVPIAYDKVTSSVVPEVVLQGYYI